MSKKTDTLLMMVGNESLQALKADPTFERGIPKGSYDVQCSIVDSVLRYNIFLNYPIFYNNLAGVLADPIWWITLVALFAASTIKEHGSAIPKDLRVSFLANASEPGEKGFEASCTVKLLLELGQEAEGQQVDAASALFMSRMDLSRM